MADVIVCSACLTEACWQGVLMCEDARRAGVRLAGAYARLRETTEENDD